MNIGMVRCCYYVRLAPTDEVVPSRLGRVQAVRVVEPLTSPVPPPPSGEPVPAPDPVEVPALVTA